MLVILLSAFILFFFSSCLALPPEVNPLSNSQIVTVQRIYVDVDVE